MRRDDAMSTEPENKPKPTSAIGIVVVLAIGLLLAAVLILPAIGPHQGHGHGRVSTCAKNLKQLGIALENYHDAYKSFPPAYVVGDNGKPMHSWRVLLLPFLEDPGMNDLYKQYR